MKYPGGFGGIFYMDFSLFTFLIGWGLLYVVPDMRVNTQMSIFGGSRGLFCPKTSTNPTRMSQTSLTQFSGCPPIDFSWLWFVSKIPDFSMMEEAKFLVLVLSYPLLNLSLEVTSEFFERRSLWLSKQCLDFSRGKGKEAL